MLQYKVPQDVQIEDKIVGPLTLRQLIFVAVGGGISYSIFLFVSEYFFLRVFDYFWIGIPLMISLAFAFIRINDVSFFKWLLLLYEFAHNARRRRWDKEETARLHFAFVTAKTGSTTKKKSGSSGKSADKSGKKGVPGKKKFSSLEELTHILDHSSPFSEHEKHLDQDHAEDSALHLTAEEKTRHEQRIDQHVTQQPQSAQSPDPNRSAAPSTSGGDQHISFGQLQKGGSVSFS